MKKTNESSFDKTPIYIMKRLCLLFFILISTENAVLSYGMNYGLYIKASPSENIERTSLVLENNKSFKLYKEMTMSFDMFVREENAFGMVFRILTKDNENIDLSIDIKAGKRYPMLVINESLNTLSKEIKYNTWIPVSITLSASKNEINFSYDNEKLILPHNVSKIKSVQISFGVSPFSNLFPNYTIYDIASVNIRNIKLFDRDELKRYWKLEKNEDTVSHDSITQTPAIINNPKWLIDDYSSWKRIYSKTLNENSLFTYRSDKHLLYLVPVDRKEIIVFDAVQNSETVITTKNSYTNPYCLNQLIYDNLKDELYIYNLKDKVVYTLSFQDLTWKPINKSVYEKGGNYWNNSTVYSPTDSTLYSFGGYGYLKFNNDLVCLNVYNNTVYKVILDQITPRFYPSTVKLGNTLYVFGGKGSQSGHQEISPRNYYDLYSVNLSTYEVNKLLEILNPKDELLLGENMIYDEKEKCFYLVTDINILTLMKIKEGQNNYEELSLPIPEYLPYSYTHRNLYLSESGKKFFALANTGAKDGKYVIDIYSLDYPPLELKSNTEIENQTQDKTSFLLLMIAILLILIVLVTGIYFILKKRKTYSDGENDDSLTFAVDKENEEVYYDFSKHSVCLLGGFNIIDKNGWNITKQFSPLLKNLFLFLILYGAKENNGVSGKKLNQIFWPDKDYVSAKNNRNVYLGKLRSALEKVGQIEIIYTDGVWNITWGENIFCDYLESLKLLSRIRDRKLPEITDIYKLLEILHRGSLLPNTELEWVDDYKRDFSNFVIDVLTELSQNADIPLSDDSKLKIADILFMHDYLSEEALYLKCSIYVNSGKKGIAKNVYESFAKEHFTLLGTKYKKQLSEVISRGNG
jgi:two-component SAPR family response regulator